MNPSTWDQIINRHQYDHLPLITGCLFAIMIMTTLRDFIYTADVTSVWFYSFEYLTTALSAVIWVGAVLKLIPVHLAHPAALVSLLCIGVKAGLAVWLWEFAGPGNIMLTLFATGLVMLSIPYALIALFLTFIAWLVPAIIYLEISAVLFNALLSVLGGGFGIAVLKRRLITLQRILELEHRVEALEAILPMCAGCKKTRTEEGSWVSVESHIESHEEGTIITHGLCPDCKESHYGDYLRQREQDSEKHTH